MKEKSSIIFGTDTIDFNIFYSKRSTLEIAVLPDMSVEVKAPTKATLKEVTARVKKRAKWIYNKQVDFETYLPKQPPRAYKSGETHRYLGRQYRLKILKSSENYTKLKGRYLECHVTEKSNTELIKATIQDWYIQHMKIIFQKRFEICISSMRKYDLSSATFVIRKMKTRWGSCTKNKNIILNPELIHTATECIDYVITHELCHLIEYNHSKSFYKILTTVLPDWKKRQKKLNMSL